MSTQIKTCLWFEKNGLEAAKFYTSLVPNSQITSSVKSDQPLVVEFNLAGVPYQILNGGPHFKLNEAASLVLFTKDQAETDYYWQALTENGGQESQCGWLKDRFGVSWQIVPETIASLLNSSDEAASQRAMQALLKMKRLIIADLETAFKG